jgi:beta-mannosidase
MFANMDYPGEDADFKHSVEREVSAFISSLSSHPCVAVLCGNSEVAQQAAMWGAHRDLWSPALFHELIPARIQSLGLDLPYWPSSALGGSFPHQNNVGTTSYYGLGAYLRPADDVRRSEVKFATECLAFANVPEAATLARMPGAGQIRVTHPAWKARSPRDLGAGWDFDDVRDHYLERFYGVDPVALRYSEHERYLELSRRVSGQAMAQAFIDWRRKRSVCGGALIWFLRDLWPGAGWGIIDSQGIPKAPYHALRKVLQPLWIGITEEGLNGLALHLGNEAADSVSGVLELTLYRDGRHPIRAARREVTLAARGTLEINAGSLLDEFCDLSHAHRFGPLSSDLIWASFKGSGAAVDTYYLPEPARFNSPTMDLQISAVAQGGDGVYRLHLQSAAFAHSIVVQADGYSCDEQYFSLPPGGERFLTLRAHGISSEPLNGYVRALNSVSPSPIAVNE